MKKAAGLALALLLVACTAEQREEFAKLRSTHEAVAKVFPGATVNMAVVNDRVVVITVVNSPLNDAPEADRAAAAKQAALASDKALNEPFESTRVVFVRQKGVGIRVTTTVASYAFTPGDLRQSAVVR